MTYGVNGEAGWIIRYMTDIMQTQTYGIESSLGEAIRTGEMLRRETKINSYWIVDRTDGQIVWERL